ncbi:Leukotriene A-4 hydrolase-like protein [Forsythia ovata]|uniref:Leukotriene A-4 hydrolase-like protein n=1 Tax=Forsythia ovata TaxID=205694 RepID=A0ABD1VFS9_9LAMI
MAAKHVERSDPVAGESLGACEDSVWCDEGIVVEELVMAGTRVYAEAVPGVLDVASRDFAGTKEINRVRERLFGPYEWERFGLLPMQLQSHFLERESVCSPNLRFNEEI